MADSKISALTAVASIDGTEEIPVNESGTTKKATGAQVAAYQETRLQQGVLCTNSASQTLTTATWTELTFDTETYKVGESSIHSTSSNTARLVAPVSGEYLLYGQVNWEAFASDHTILSRLRLNGSSTVGLIRQPSLNDAGTAASVNIPSVVLQLSASDYITLEAQHDRGSDTDVLAANTRFGMYLMGR